LDDSEDDKDFDRTVALGYLVEAIGVLCGPRLWVLNEIASALVELDHSETDHETLPHHPH
jgi:hypothetical protein